ncbi:MAG: molybdopterin cofactor-binding domain-containing protein, partial [Pseudomonadota bacterium]
MNHVHRHLTGAGRFIADEALPGMGHMVVLRADVAHGVIAGLDVAEARAMPGVRTVLTAEELAREGIGRMGCREVVEGINGPMIEPRRPVLAEGKVVHVGQPIAAIVADTEAEAQSAAEAVEIDIDPLPAVIDPTTATEAPAIWPEAPDNRALIWEGGNVEETKRLTASAAHVVEVKVEHPRIAISPIETRGCLGDWQGGQYTLITPSQGVVSLRHAMAEVLGCP